MRPPSGAVFCGLSCGLGRQNSLLSETSQVKKVAFPQAPGPCSLPEEVECTAAAKQRSTASLSSPTYADLITPVRISLCFSRAAKGGDDMQDGSVTVERRERGPDVWCFRWREAGPDGRRIHRRIVLGTADELKSISSAQKTVVGLRREININDIRIRRESIKVVRSIEAFPAARACRPQSTHFVFNEEGLRRLLGKVD